MTLSQDTLESVLNAAEPVLPPNPAALSVHHSASGSPAAASAAPFNPGAPSAFEYHSYSRYLQKTFGGKTYKVVVASQLTCPTRDGTLAKRGCAFCDLRGSASFHGKQGRGLRVVEQIEKRIGGVKKRFSAEKFLAYFQSYTNTYAEVSYLREIYTEALSHPEISGLCIGTRPDCLPDGVIELLEELAQKHYVSLELGVQSFEDPALLWLDRGHDGQCSVDALKRLKEKAPHVHTCAHLMFGTPVDSPSIYRDAALQLNALGVNGVKLHQIMVLEFTVLAERYREAPFKTLEMDEYTVGVAEFLKHLNPEIYVERLFALSSHPDELIAPKWSNDHWGAHNGMKALLNQMEVKQGSLYTQA